MKTYGHGIYVSNNSIFCYEPVAMRDAGYINVCDVIFFTACIEVRNIANWPWAEGFYTQDDSLQECDSSGKPRYRQVSGTGFLWHHSTGYWYGTNDHCLAVYDHIQFKQVNTGVDSPDKAAAGSWQITNTERNAFAINTPLTVTAVSGDKCGRSFLSKYTSF